MAENREDEWLQLAGSASAFSCGIVKAAALVRPRALPFIKARLGEAQRVKTKLDLRFWTQFAVLDG